MSASGGDAKLFARVRAFHFVTRFRTLDFRRQRMDDLPTLFAGKSVESLFLSTVIVVLVHVSRLYDSVPP